MSHASSFILNCNWAVLADREKEGARAIEIEGPEYLKAVSFCLEREYGLFSSVENLI